MSNTPQQNLFLAALPAEVRHRLYGHLELVSLSVGEILFTASDPVRHVYFPTDSIVSLLYELNGRALNEISVVGNEGLVGVSVCMGGTSALSRAIVQNAGHAYRLPTKQLREELSHSNELLLLMLRYTQSLITQMSQTAICIRRHTTDQQLIRWLLLSLDRLPGDSLTTTQEFIEDLFGLRRKGISDAAAKLQKMGLIEYHCGHIRVPHRPELEKLSCECYEVVKKDAARLLPYLHSLQVH